MPKEGDVIWINFPFYFSPPQPLTTDNERAVNEAEKWPGRGAKDFNFSLQMLSLPFSIKIAYTAQAQTI